MSLADAVDGPMPGRLLCRDCAHINNGSCERPIGKHFDAGINSYRNKLHVSAAMERGRTRTLTRRPTCGPDAQFFEPKGSRSPILPVTAQPEVNDFIVPADPVAHVIDLLQANPPEVIKWARDTIADSDGDDGA